MNNPFTTTVLAGYGEIKLSFLDIPVECYFEFNQEIKVFLGEVKRKSIEYKNDISKKSSDCKSSISEKTIFYIKMRKNISLCTPKEKYITEYDFTVKEINLTDTANVKLISQTEETDLNKVNLLLHKKDVQIPVVCYDFNLMRDFRLVSYEFHNNLEIYVKDKV